MIDQTDQYKDAAADFHQEMQELASKRVEQGLCVHCGDNPINPSLPGQLCLECWEESEIPKCLKNGCVNISKGHFMQAPLCEIHLVDAIHQEYQRWISQKDSLEERKRDLLDRAADANIDPTKYNGSCRGMSDEKNKILDEWVQLKSEQRNLHFLEQDIKDAIDELEQPFHDNFTTFSN